MLENIEWKGDSPWQQNLEINILYVIAGLTSG